MMKAPSTKQKMFCPTKSLSKMVMFPKPQYSALGAKTFYSQLRLDKKSITSGIYGLEKLAFKPDFREKYHTVIIYHNQPSKNGQVLRKYVDGKLIPIHYPTVK